MIWNYLTIAIRNLSRNKLFTGINVVGLGLGLSCVMLILLYSKDEVSFDRFHVNAPSIYRVVTERFEEKGKESWKGGNTGMVQGPGFKMEIPEVETFVRVQGEQTTVRVGSQVFQQKGHYVDDNFFSVFTFPLLEGDPKTVLKDLHSVVLTEQTAKRLLGKVDVVGKTIELPLGEKRAFIPFTVTGILPESPQNSSFQLSMVLPMKLNEQDGGDKNWINFYLNTFLVIKPGSNLPLLEKKMQQVYEVLAKKDLIEMREKYNMKDEFVYGLQPFTNIHLDTEQIAENGLDNPSNPLYSRILGGIALFILIIACINFINLSVARSLKRAKEVGVRKVIGGERNQLFYQFMVESTFLCFIAFTLALFITEFSLPVFNKLANKSLSLSYLVDAKLILFYFGLFVLTSFLAGAYPSLVLSGFNPVKTLYNRTRFSGKNYLAKSLVVLQFTLTTFLIIATITIYRQFDFLTTRDLGYNDERILITNAPRMNASKLSRVKNELLQQPGVEKVTGTKRGSWTTVAKVNGKEMDFALEVIDPDFLSLYQIPMAKGRSLSYQFPTDSTDNILVNETFARQAGWTNLEGKFVDFFYDSVKFNVVGIVKDYHYESLLSNIRPQLFSMSSRYSYGSLKIKIKPESMAATLACIEKVYKENFPYEPYIYSFQDEENRAQYESEARWKDIIGYAALLTIFVSCMGLFGLATLSAEKRIKEIGIRKVLGASVSGIVATLSTGFLKLILLATLLAFPAAWFSLDHWLQDYPFRIHLDAWMFGLAGLLVVILGLTTVGFQAVKSALANPVKSLRTE